MKSYGLSAPSVTALLVLLLALVVFSLSAGIRPLTTRGEGREGLMVRDMQAQANYVLPLRLSNVVPSKPPMFHWLAVGSAKLFGQLTPFTLRFPSALAAALSLVLIFLFTWRPFASTRALVPVIITATSFEFFRAATHARVDMCFSFFLLAAILLSFRIVNHCIDKTKISYPEVLLLGVLFTAAVLTKGPTGLIIPLAVSLLYAGLSQSGFARSDLAHSRGAHAKRQLLTFSPLLLAALLGTCLAGIWYLLAFRQSGSAFLETQLLRENIGRIFRATGAEVGHEKGIVLGFLDFFVASLPWGLLLPLVIAWVARHRSSLGEKSFRPELLSIVTIAVFLFAVLVSRSKRPVYFLPCLSFYAYLLLQAAEDFDYSPRLKTYFAGIRRASLGLRCLALLLLLTLSLHLFALLPASLAKTISVGFALLPLPVPSETLFILTAIVSLFFILATLSSIEKHLKQGNLMDAGRQLAVLMCGLFFVVSNSFVAQLFANHRLPAFTEEVSSELAQGRVLYQYERIFYPLSFYLGHAHPILPKDATVPYPLEKTSLLIREDNLAEVLLQFPKAQQISKSTLASGSSKHGALLLRLE